MLRAYVLATALCLTVSSASSDIIRDKQSNVSDALPSDVLEIIRNAKSTHTIYPIQGTEKTTAKIIKADEIVFGPGATLELDSRGHDWIAIVAKKWKFVDPSETTGIRSWGYMLRPAEVGANGVDRPAATGEIDRIGNDGKHGGDGGAGSIGGSEHQPRVYLIVETFETLRGHVDPEKLLFYFGGTRGQDGGQGGKGGNGGDGAPGKEGAVKGIFCDTGGGRGGHGGNAGRGGKGGDGAPGGRGADLVVIAPETIIELVSWAKIDNRGGAPGLGGKPGAPGIVGKGGTGARSNLPCSSKSAGNPGNIPDPDNLGYGADSRQDGDKGEVKMITVPSVQALFN